MQRKVLIKLLLGETKDSEPLYGTEENSVRTLDNLPEVGETLSPPTVMKGVKPIDFLVEEITPANPNEANKYDSVVYLRQKVMKRAPSSTAMATGVRGYYVQDYSHLTFVERMAIHGI